VIGLPELKARRPFQDPAGWSDFKKSFEPRMPGNDRCLDVIFGKQ